MSKKNNQPTDPVVTALLQKFQGIMLDVGCGRNKQGGDYIGMDMVKFPGVDIVHDLNIHPWPLPDECCIRVIASHVVEHIPPVMIDPERGTWSPFVEFMNEVWRVTKTGCQFIIKIPHGASFGYLQDPTHCNPTNQDTWRYFDPIDEKFGGGLYYFYQPMPWKIEIIAGSNTGNMEVVLVKRPLDPSYHPEEETVANVTRDIEDYPKGEK